VHRPCFQKWKKVRPRTAASDGDIGSYRIVELLYELLAGCRPDQAAGCAPHEIAQATCGLEPEKPSVAAERVEAGEILTGSAKITSPTLSALREGSPQKLRKRLRGDLDNIVLMALRKEPERRYASVEQFAGDIRRHSESVPVLARTDSFVYRGSKFITRHPAGVVTAVVVVLTLLVGFTITLHEAHIARRQRILAEQRFNDVRELAHSLLFDLHDSIQDLPGSTVARKLLVDRALKY